MIPIVWGVVFVCCILRFSTCAFNFVLREFVWSMIFWKPRITRIFTNIYVLLCALICITLRIARAITNITNSFNRHFSGRHSCHSLTTRVVLV